MEANKTEGEILKEKLFCKKVNGWEGLDSNKKGEVFNYCDGYIDFLNKCKTEREVTRVCKRNGY